MRRHRHHRSGTSEAEPMATKKEGRETGAGEMPNFNNAATCQVQKVDKNTQLE